MYLGPACAGVYQKACGKSGYHGAFYLCEPKSLGDAPAKSCVYTPGASKPTTTPKPPPTKHTKPKPWTRGKVGHDCTQYTKQKFKNLVEAQAACDAAWPKCDSVYDSVCGDEQGHNPHFYMR